MSDKVDHLLLRRRENAEQRIAIVALGSQELMNNLRAALIRHLKNFLVVVANIAVRNKSKKTRLGGVDFFLPLSRIIHKLDGDQLADDISRT